MSKTASARQLTRSGVSRKTARTPRKLRSSGKPTWSLPSGESLAEFALRFGFLAPTLLRPKSAREPQLPRPWEMR